MVWRISVWVGGGEVGSSLNGNGVANISVVGGGWAGKGGEGL